MKKIVIVSLLLIGAVCRLLAINVVPLPHYATRTGENFYIENTVEFAEYLQADKYSQINSLYIGLKGCNKNFDRLCKEANFFQEELGEQGYELLIDNRKILLAANTSQGLFYGKQTLLQLVCNCKNSQLVGWHVIDKPSLKYRGIMDDISRGPIPTKEYMKYQIRRLAELKLNMLCYYTEHVVKTEKHPEFAPPGVNLSIEDWKEINDYAKKYYVELVPNFQSLGHAEKVLQNPKYRHLAESNTMYAPTNPETISFLEDIYNEMCPAFNSTYFHVNCDETFDLGRGPSKIMTDSIGIENVYVNYIKQLRNILRTNHKKMMMWGDIVLKYPKIMSILPKDVIIMTWEYGDYDSFSKWIDPFVRVGFNYMICTGVLNSLRLFPNYKQAIPNIRNFIREGVQKGAMGMLNTIWDEGGLHSFDQDWYGVAYGADHSWNPNDETIENFDERLSYAVYQSSGKELFKAIHMLTDLSENPLIDNMSETSFWKVIIPQRGKFNSYRISGWQEVYDNCIEIDSILSNKTASKYIREYAAIQLVSDEYKYLSQAKIKMGEASSLYAEACCTQMVNRKKTIELLSKVKEYIIDCQNKLIKLKGDFCTIWKNENYDYWLNYEMDPFEQLLADYNDVIKSLDKSVSYFENGQPLLSPSDIRLDIREQNNSYFTYWLISPAFKLDNGTEYASDFLIGMGGEKKASPYPGFSFFNEKSENLKWIKYSSPFSDRVSFNDVLFTHGKSVAYAFCTLESPDDKDVTAYLGVGGGIEVFCNGDIVLSKFGRETFLIDEFKCTLKLRKGKNRILLKVENGSKLWDFSFRLKDQMVSNSKNKYKIIPVR